MENKKNDIEYTKFSFKYKNKTVRKTPLKWGFDNKNDEIIIKRNNVINNYNINIPITEFDIKYGFDNYKNLISKMNNNKYTYSVNNKLLFDVEETLNELCINKYVEDRHTTVNIIYHIPIINYMSFNNDNITNDRFININNVKYDTNLIYINKNNTFKKIGKLYLDKKKFGDNINTIKCKVYKQYLNRYYCNLNHDKINGIENIYHNYTRLRELTDEDKIIYVKFDNPNILTHIGIIGSYCSLKTFFKKRGGKQLYYVDEERTKYSDVNTFELYYKYPDSNNWIHCLSFTGNINSFEETIIELNTQHFNVKNGLYVNELKFVIKGEVKNPEMRVACYGLIDGNKINNNIDNYVEYVIKKSNITNKYVKDGRIDSYRIYDNKIKRNLIKKNIKIDIKENNTL